MLFDDTERGGQAQSGAFAFFFCGEEWLKYLFDRGRVHSHAAVRYGELNIMPWRDRSIAAAIFVVQIGIARFDREPAANGHGIAAIETKVQQDLLDLCRVRFGGT